jgi:hypothetical protein
LIIEYFDPPSPHGTSIQFFCIAVKQPVTLGGKHPTGAAVYYYKIVGGHND